VLVNPVSAYLTAIVFGSVLNRNVHMINVESARAASAIGSNIAHELRTPLMPIGNLARGISHHLPTLVDAYQKARQHQLPVVALTATHIDRLRSSLLAIEKEVVNSNTAIDILLLNTNDRSLGEFDADLFSIRDLVHECVQHFPYNNTKEQRLVSVQPGDDFQVFAPKIVVAHVILNLIKNALYHVQRSGKGSVSIGTILAKRKHKVTVHDSGPGIPYADRDRIFERFFTTTVAVQGVGIGLSFCRSAMDSIGGRITVDSREGHYSTFILEFPRPRQRRRSRARSSPR
jgi:two-component system CAI-1 autoinducer sensor kinase/phosphatase CqsS